MLKLKPTKIQNNLKHFNILKPGIMPLLKKRITMSFILSKNQIRLNSSHWLKNIYVKHIKNLKTQGLRFQKNCFLDSELIIYIVATHQKLKLKTIINP